VKRALAALLLLGCGGPLAGARLAPLAESQGQVMAALSIASLAGIEGAEGSTSARALLFSRHDLPPAALQLVAAERPLGLAVVRTEQGPASRPTAVSAIAFQVQDPEGARHWLERLGSVAAHRGDLFLVGSHWAEAHDDQVILSDSREGLLAAGNAARAAAHEARGRRGEARLTVHPPRWAPSQRQELGELAAAFLDRLRHGRVLERQAGTTAALLVASNARHLLSPFDEAESAVLTAVLEPAGARLSVRTSPRAGIAALPPLLPTLDRAVAGDPHVAALGALDCRRRLFVRQPSFVSAWRATAGVGADQLTALVQAEERALDGTCSFAVHTQHELWAEEASYPLRSGAAAAPLAEALVSAIRAGGLPNLESAASELRVGKLLYSRGDDGVLALDRVLGAPDSARTRHAAALYGGITLRDRLAVSRGRLLFASGAHADQRMAALLSPPAPELPPELSAALAEGRGRAGYLFLDLTALWKPYLKAAQVTQDPLAELVARDPALFDHRRPAVVTLEPGSPLDATITMPVETWHFLLAAALMLFGR
jgi:hypothetical protein